jgi:molybdopterin-guanine dinucleotide biosynthesis protein A
MGRDKTAAGFLFQGEPLAARVAGLLGRVCAEVLVASGDGRRLAWLGLPQVADARPGAGPLGGLVAGLERASHPLVAAVGADMPHVSPPLLTMLAELAAGHDAVVPVGPRGIEPLHAVYRRDSCPALSEALRQERLALREALAGLRVRFVEEDEWRVADPTGRFAENVNREEDLRPPEGGPLPNRRAETSLGGG